MISAIIVAAGKSSRMGAVDKLKLPFRKSTILETVVYNLLDSKADEVILVTGGQSSLAADFEDARLTHATNHSPDDGLTSSIQTGVRFVEPEHAFLICLADMPLITTEEYNKLIERYLEIDSKVIIQPFFNGHPGNPVLFSSHFRKEILNIEAGNGCKIVVQANRQYVKRLEVESKAYFTDIDTVEQYKKLKENRS